MKAGYVISGVIFTSLATVFAFIAGLLAVIVSFNNAAVNAGASSASLLAGDYQNALILTLIVGALFYIIAGIFLWQGFKTPRPVYYPPKYPASYTAAYGTIPSYGPGMPSQFQQQQPGPMQPASGMIPTPISPSSATSSNIPATALTQAPTPGSVSTVMANCPKCNARISAEAKFCPSCGTDLRPKPLVDPVVRP